MSDTPRTDARVQRMIANGESPEGLEHWAQQLERELNAAEERIKRLEVAGDALCVTMQRESKYLHGENFKASIKLWTKAKEAKP